MSDPIDLPSSHGAEKLYTGVPSADELAAGRFDQRPGITIYREHGAKNWMICITVAGSAAFSAGESEVAVGPGDFVQIAPGTLQRYRAAGPGRWSHYWVHFQPRPDWFSWWRLRESAPGFVLLRFHDQERFALVADAFERTCRNAMLSSRDTPQGRQLSRWSEPAELVRTQLALNGIEEVLLLAMVEQELASRRPCDERVQRVLDTIAADTSRPMTVETLARSVSLSPSRLTHLFRAETGDSISNVILTARLRQARQLLEITDEPIRRIAAEVGFSSPYYFSRQFHARFGVPPSAFREQARGRPAPAREN